MVGFASREQLTAGTPAGRPSCGGLTTMPVTDDLSRAQMEFQVDGGPSDEFLVVRFRGTEGLCQLYRFEIDLVTKETEIDFDAIVEKPAVLRVKTGNGDRRFHGIIAEFEITDQTHEQLSLRAQLVPAVWLLSHRYDSRIFQELSTPDIVADVLRKGGVPSDRFRFTLSETYVPRDYCVQYRETDYNFICRLLEEEGIWWYFEQTEEGDVLVMADAAAAYAALEGDAQVRFCPPTGLNVKDEHVYRFRLGRCVRPGAVMLSDFNFENPRLDLRCQADDARDADLAFSDYPGEYTTQSRGSSLAKLRAEEFESRRIWGIGQSNSHRFAPARTFELTDHPAGQLNASYVLTSVTHQGKESTTRSTAGSNGRRQILDGRIHQSLMSARNHENATIRELAEALLQIGARLSAGDPTAHRELTQWLYHAGQVSRDLASTASVSGGNPLDPLSIPNLLDDIAAGSLVDYDAPVYECRFECMPSDVSYRPPRITPWPVMRGTQTAIIVGPESEEIYCDEYGRVKVQFHWDREDRFSETASCWIRVSQGMAGGNYGIMFLPRVGQEVVVDFLEGDPDKPIIIGRVFNADHMPPYPLPDEKTKSVIKTHSSKGGGGCNEIRFEDLKGKEQLFIQAERQMDTNVKASHLHTVGGSYHVHVGGEKDGALQGELREKVFKAKHVHIKGELRTWVEQDEGRAIDGNRATEIQGSDCLLVHKDAVDTYEVNHKHEVGATYAAKASDIKLEASGSIELKAGGSSIVLSAGGIWIDGSMVYINSGAGAPVSPVGAAGFCPPAAEDAGVADSSRPGKDTRYDREPSEAAEAPAEVTQQESEEGEDQKKKTSWIEIELVDEADMPVAGEPYELELPDGKIRSGSLDANGLARIEDIEAGTCQICFPRLDGRAWERI